MTHRRLAAGLLAGLVATAAPAEARAQGFLDAIFGSKKPAEPAPTPAPAPSAPAGTKPSPSGAAPAPAASAETRAPLPPRRPASLAGAPTEHASAPAPMPPPPGLTPAAPAQVATASVAAPLPVATGPLSERAALDRANAYFNSISTLVADFAQVGGDGRRLGGKLYLQRPGRIRFEYEAPSTLEVVADGSSVAVRDRKLATQDIYSLSQTPLKFLLRDKIDLTKDVRVTDVETDAEGVRIALEDRSTLGGTSKITLSFDPEVTALTRWRIIDPQGFQTTVLLSNLDKGRRVDQRLFVIDFQRMQGEGSNR